MRNQIPKAEGISGERRVYGDEAAGRPLERLKSGASLVQLQTDYVFFSYAPMFLYGGLTFNPVQEWINLHNMPQCVFIVPMPMRVFNLADTTLGETKWDKILWAVEKEYWERLALHIGSIGLIDRGKKLFSRGLCQAIPVVDVAAVDKMQVLPTQLPTVEIFVFGVDSNRGCIAFPRPKNLLVELPRLVNHGTLPETARMAKALFENNPNPYQQSQPLPWETNAHLSPLTAPSGSTSIITAG